MAIFATASLVLGCAGSLLLCVLVLRRVYLELRADRRLRLEDALRPALLAFLEEGGSVSIPERGRERRLVVDLLGRYGSMLRGPARARIAAELERSGVVARELELLRGRRAWRRALAAHRLGDIGPESAVPGLLAALSDPDRTVRLAAARSLGRLRSADAVEPLLGSLVGGLVPDWIVRWALLEIGAPALPELRTLLTVAEPAERAAATELVGLLGDASDAPALAERLRDSAAAVRGQAARALGRLGSEATVPALLDALDDRVPDVRAAAAEALGRLLEQRAKGALLAQARDDAFEPARAAAHALARIDPLLVAAEAESDSPYLREAADLAALR